MRQASCSRFIGWKNNVFHRSTTFAYPIVCRAASSKRHAGTLLGVCSSTGTRRVIQLPHESWLDKIGNTPIIEVEKDVYAKLEGNNPSGSHKDRALTALLLGLLDRDDECLETVALVTSGSAGNSLALFHKALTEMNPNTFQLRLNIIAPLAYKDKPGISAISNIEGVKTWVGGFKEYLSANNDDNDLNSVNLILEDSNFQETMDTSFEVAADLGWTIADQHHDEKCMHGHRTTAEELMHQLPSVDDVVCATGTGAVAAALSRYLPSHVRVHSRPAHSGTIDGLTDIRNYDNYCSSANLVGYQDEYFLEEDAKFYQEMLWSEHGIRAGQSSGSCYMLARAIKKDTGRKVAFICADGVQSNPSNSYRSASYRSTSADRNPTLQQNRLYSCSARKESSPSFVDNIVLGGGPIGTATAYQIAEKAANNNSSASTLLIHDPKNHGAHEDWSRLARLSFDGTPEELALSRHATDLIRLVDDVQSYNSGAPIIPISPGMLFLASPGTDLADACINAEKNYGDPTFIRRYPEELHQLYPGNNFNLPRDTLCWSHPLGMCVSPIELCNAQLRMAKAYGIEVREDIGQIDIVGEDSVKVSLRSSGESFVTKNCFVFCGAQNKQIFEEAVRRDGNTDLSIPEFDATYITAISTVRYNHALYNSNTEFKATAPIVLGQIEVPELLDFQANFSIVPEEGGVVLKARLSGSAGSEVIPVVSALHETFGPIEDAEMARLYRSFFGTLFPFMETSKPLDFNRCVTYRNHGNMFSGTSLLEKRFGDSRIMTTVGCYGVGVKFGPILGEAAASVAFNEDPQNGTEIHESGDPILMEHDEDLVARAW